MLHVVLNDGVIAKDDGPGEAGMKAVFVKPNDARPNLKDCIVIKTRSLGAGRGERVYVSLLEGIDFYGTGQRDFESTTDVLRWMDAIRKEMAELGWDERLPKRYRRARR